MTLLIITLFVHACRVVSSFILEQKSGGEEGGKLFDSIHSCWGSLTIGCMFFFVVVVVVFFVLFFLHVQFCRVCRRVTCGVWRRCRPTSAMLSL